MRGRAGCWVQLGAPEPHPAPTWRFCLHVTERPRLRAEVQPFLLLSQGPMWAACWALLPKALGAAPTPRRKGPRSRRCHRGGGGLGAGQGVCAPRTDLGAIVLLFVTGVTPSGCPWGPSRHHPSTGEPRVRQGRGAGRKGGDCPQSCT